MGCRMEGVSVIVAEVAPETRDTRLLYKAPPTRSQVEAYARSG